jgi:hypothetical protein
MSAPRSPRWADDLVHPLPATAVVVLIVNDHLLKGGPWLPSWLTGKLSDFAGLFFFPLLLVAIAQGLAGPRHRGALVAAAAAATALVFSTLKLVPALQGWLPAGVSIVPDPTDLLALPMVGLAVIWLGRPRRPAGTFRAEVARLAVIGLAVFGSAATSRPIRRDPALPYWRVVSTSARTVECADIAMWVSKSGKTGVGVTLGLATQLATCSLELRSAHLRADGVTSSANSPRAFQLQSGRIVHHYIPFPFDNDAFWRAGKRAGEVILVFAAEGAVLRPLTVSMEQRMGRAHEMAVFDEGQPAGCGVVTFEVIAMDSTRIGWRVQLRPFAERTACRLRFDGARVRGDRPGDRVSLAPALHSWHTLPATWMLEVTGEQQGPPMIELDLSDGGAKTHTVAPFLIDMRERP